jgi:hypothetical protein
MYTRSWVTCMSIDGGNIPCDGAVVFAVESYEY